MDALAKTEGIEITKAEAESFLAELDNFELDSKALDKIAGGSKYMDCYKANCKSFDS